MCVTALRQNSMNPATDESLKRKLMTIHTYVCETTIVLHQYPCEYFSTEGERGYSFQGKQSTPKGMFF